MLWLAPINRHRLHFSCSVVETIVSNRFTLIQHNCFLACGFQRHASIRFFFYSQSRARLYHIMMLCCFISRFLPSIWTSKLIKLCYYLQLFICLLLFVCEKVVVSCRVVFILFDAYFACCAMLLNFDHIKLVWFFIIANETQLHDCHRETN